jgi:hypothetical protein
LTACSPRWQRCMLRRDRRPSMPSRGPAPAKAAACSPRPTPVGEYDACVDGKPAPTARARSSARAASNWPRETRMIRPAPRRCRPWATGERDRVASDRRGWRASVLRLGPLGPGRPGDAGLVADLAELLEEP